MNIALAQDHQDVAIYRPPVSSRVLAICFGIILAAGGIFGLVLAVSDPGSADKIFVTFSTALLACGSAILRSTIRYRVVLTPGDIVVRSSWKTNRMQQRDVIGYRVMPQYGGNEIILLSRHGPKNGLHFVLSFKVDAVFERWFADIPAL